MFCTTLILYRRHDESPTRLWIARATSFVLPSFMVFLLFRFRRLLEAYRVAKQGVRNVQMETAVTKRARYQQEKFARDAVRYLIERYADDDDDEIGLCWVRWDAGQANGAHNAK
jgi:hypothetical protein